MPQPAAPARTAARAWGHALIFGLLLYAGFEGLCELALRSLAGISSREYRPIDAAHLTSAQRDVLHRMVTHDLGYLQHDPVLGWSIQHLGWGPDGLYRSNAQGVRADVDVPLVAPRHGLRIAAFGDSFTHGDEVAVADTWEEQLAASLRHVKVLNFGVPGYGVDQALLHYERDGVPLQPDVVLIGFMTENVYRHLNVFRPFYYPDTGIPLAKPRYRLVDDRLTLEPNPLPRVEDYQRLLDGDPAVWTALREHDAYASWRPTAARIDRLPSVRLSKYVAAERRRRAGEREITDGARYRVDGEAFRLTVALLMQFAATAREHGAIPIVLIFPERDDLQQLRANGTLRYTELVRVLRANGLQVVDLIEAFRDASPTLEEFAVDHYSASGNARVARQLNDYLTRVTIPQIVERRFLGAPPERPL